MYFFTFHGVFQKSHFLSRRQDINFFLIQTYNSPHFIHSTVFFTFEAREVCHRNARRHPKHDAPSGQGPRFMWARAAFRAGKKETPSPTFAWRYKRLKDSVLTTRHRLTGKGRSRKKRKKCGNLFANSNKCSIFAPANEK